jgi:hypothetical protein
LKDSWNGMELGEGMILKDGIGPRTGLREENIK